jgi:acyl-CoA synthetase (NDP forming)
MRQAHRDSGKPLFLVSNRQGTGSDPVTVEATREGFPVLDGLRPFLRGVNCLLNYRDFCHRKASESPVISTEKLEHVRAVLGQGQPGEVASLEVLRKAGLPIVQARPADSMAAVLEAASTFGYPVAMKTAEEGIQHKTDQGGVILDIPGDLELASAYRTMSSLLGPRVLLTPMVKADGLEMLLGMIRDPQFGPLVIMGIGGIRVEALHDVVSVLPPFDATTARRLLENLEHSELLEYRRGTGLPDVDQFCEAAALFSVLVASLDDMIEEMEMNPVIVHANGCIAVDAMIVTTQDKEQD